ncbi:hypothetical protein B0H19DRAFT_1319614, partial [Mycena capillaripes]
GSCSIPQIEFGVGFDNRKETSFQPADQTSFDHGSAQAIAIITQFICDTLTNKCGADATAKATCKSAQDAANAAPPKTGIDADIFNGFFGIATNFRNVEAVDDQGNAIAGSTGGSVTVAAVGAAETGAAATVTGAAPAATAISAVDVAAASSSIGDFGSCSIPQIEFGVGFDNRKETSFQPTDQTSFNHGSAQAIAIITQFICDTLTNKCGADATAKATCKSAQDAANAAPPRPALTPISSTASSASQPTSATSRQLTTRVTPLLAPLEALLPLLPLVLLPQSWPAVRASWLMALNSSTKPAPLAVHAMSSTTLAPTQPTLEEASLFLSAMPKMMPATPPLPPRLPPRQFFSCSSSKLEVRMSFFSHDPSCIYTITLFFVPLDTWQIHSADTISFDEEYKCRGPRPEFDKLTWLLARLFSHRQPN